MSDNQTNLIDRVEKRRISLDKMEDRDSSLSSTLIRGLEILGCFQVGEQSLTNAQIAARVGINKATVSRLCKTLISMRYLRRDPNGGFRLAPGVLALSYPILSSMKWRQQAIGIMRDFADFAKGNAHLSVFNGPDAVYIQTAGDISNFPHVPEMGMTIPLADSATGRSLLSMLSEEERAEKFIEIELAYPGALARSGDRIEKGIKSCKERGFCASFGEWRANIYAISAPVGRTSDGLDVTISCGIPAYRARKEEVENDLGPRLASVAQNLRLFNIFGT
ncbi:helix-turn-helix domain-containing protein [Sneathiella chungangensis]|uniref:Helix-turn-helix domain-containing protein n=1 Tax=Sneathiella chungangensis TaxID=1418234 RepID=A0A845MHS0_9PROT|nr:IclR family transcriptional regulator [Sneathiella chungangensis]MZR22866.1 helix-turn-helix domain-containing protein [Sneathiella chungangensis]